MGPKKKKPLKPVFHAIVVNLRLHLGPASTASAQPACVQEGDLDALQALIANDPDVVAERNPDKYCCRDILRRVGHLL